MNFLSKTSSVPRFYLASFIFAYHMLVPPILNKGVSARINLPVAKQFKIRVLNDLAPRELLDLHVFVPFAFIPEVAGSDDATLDGQEPAEDGERELHPR